MRIERILMPTDFSDCANAALTHAVALAHQFGAELHLLHAVVLHEEDPNRPGHSFPGLEELHRRLKEAAATGMEQLINDRQTKGITVFKAQRRGLTAAPEILAYAEDEAIDLIVLGTHGRRGLRHFLLGSVAEEVLRSANCPVLTIRDEEEVRRFHEVDLIVVPFDFSADSRRALEVARDLAAAYKSRIEVVHAVEAAMMLSTYSIDFDYGAVFRRIERRLGEEIESLGDQDISIEPRVLDGHAASAITRHAEGSQADLIVLASHGLSGLWHFMLGSVAEKVIRSASCPVLTLRPPTEQAKS